MEILELKNAAVDRDEHLPGRVQQLHGTDREESVALNMGQQESSDLNDGKNRNGKNNEQSPGNLWNDIKRPNSHFSGVPEGRERQVREWIWGNSP